MTIKASSLLSVIAIWAAMIPAVIAQPDAWWSLVFAGMATMAVGIGFWRRLGLSRVIAIAGIWAGTALIVGNGEATWPSVFAFLATSAVVYSMMKRDAYILGLGIAAVWLATALIVVNQHDAARIAVFAFLTAATTASSRSRWSKGAAAMVWWGIATAIILAADGVYWLAVIAWLLGSASLGFRDWNFPRGIEWDILERDERRSGRDGDFL